MIRNRSVCELADGSFFIYNGTMNTDYIIRLMMCGLTRVEAILLADEYEEDEEDLLQMRIEAMEEEKRKERVARIQSLAHGVKSGGLRS